MVEFLTRSDVDFEAERKQPGYLRVPHCVIPLGQRLMARDFDRQVAKLQVRIAVLNGYAALGIPVTKAAAYVSPGKGKRRSSANLCNRVA